MAPRKNKAMPKNGEQPQTRTPAKQRVKTPKRKTAGRPRYTLQISGGERNGRIHRHLIDTRDLEGNTRATDAANLYDGAQLRSAARRLAQKLEVDAEELEANLSNEWAKYQTQQRKQSEQAEAASDPPCSPCSPGSVYEERGHRIYLRRRTREAGDFLEPLANFTARIIGEDVIDDGSGEARHVFQIEGTLENGQPLPVAAVPSSEFSGMSWVLKEWGCRANPSAGMGARDHLRAAVQGMSGNPPRRVLYQHTGWRLIGDTWHYLHAGGGIGPQGAVPTLCMDLSGKLKNYSLPPPPVGNELIDAVRAEVRLLDSCCPRLAYPLLGAVYRAVLGPTDCSLSLVGRTGLGKSEWAALAQQHFGADMHRLNLPGNWSSTANALESLAFLVKDAVLVLDDFKPGGSKGEIDAWHAKADRVLRAQGNNSARQRCRPDGSVRVDRPPRGFIIVTGEDLPRGESLRARNLVLRMRAGEFAIATLTPFQKDAAAGLYAQALVAFVAWLAPQYDQVRGRLPAEFAGLRSRALAAENHPRTPGIIADLALGLKYFLDFALHVGAIEPWDRDTHAQRGWQLLLGAATEQTQELLALDPPRRFLQLLAAAIASGRAHLVGPDGAEPGALERPIVWGWRLEEFGSGEHATMRWRSQGKAIGWVDGENVYLNPDAAYAEAQRFGDDQGERLPLSQSQLYRQLRDSKLLARHEQFKTTIRVTLQGAARAVLYLRPGVLSPPGEQGEQGEQGERR
jgi:hypothetical protein